MLGIMMIVFVRSFYLYIIIILVSTHMISMFPSSVVNCAFETHSGQTKDNTIGICCFSPTGTTISLEGRGGGVVKVFFLKKIFWLRKKNNLIQSFCHMT